MYLLKEGYQPSQVAPVVQMSRSTRSSRMTRSSDVTASHMSPVSILRWWWWWWWWWSSGPTGNRCVCFTSLCWEIGHAILYLPLSVHLLFPPPFLWMWNRIKGYVLVYRLTKIAWHLFVISWQRRRHLVNERTWLEMGTKVDHCQRYFYVPANYH